MTKNSLYIRINLIISKAECPIQQKFMVKPRHFCLHLPSNGITDVTMNVIKLIIYGLGYGCAFAQTNRNEVNDNLCKCAEL